MKPDYISMPDWNYLKNTYKNNLNDVLDKLDSGYPIQYLIGNVEFLNTTIYVDERVLIPRFETENLVDLTIKRIKDRLTEPVSILDLATGSGCIAIALKKNLNCNVTATDISVDALELAKYNANYNNVEVAFLNKSIDEGTDKFYDLIISNPPYIPEDGYVSKSVLEYEPHLALFAKDNGLYFYKVILENYLPNCKILALEFGDNQKDDLEELVKDTSHEFLTDFQGLPRYLFIYNE